MHLSTYKIFYFINDFNKDHIIKLKKNISLIYRNYNEKLNLQYLKEIRDFCKSKGLKIYLANNLKVAVRLKFDGIYIPSFNKKIIGAKNLRKNFLILGSAHNLTEIREKEKQGVNSLFLSPLFHKENKKALGLYKFINLQKLTKTKIVALGGINQKNINKLGLIKINQFASISYINNIYAK